MSLPGKWGTTRGNQRNLYSRVLEIPTAKVLPTDAKNRCSAAWGIGARRHWWCMDSPKIRDQAADFYRLHPSSSIFIPSVSRSSHDEFTWILKWIPCELTVNSDQSLSTWIICGTHGLWFPIIFCRQSFKVAAEALSPVAVQSFWREGGPNMRPWGREGIEAMNLRPTNQEVNERYGQIWRVIGSSAINSLPGTHFRYTWKTPCCGSCDTR